MPPDPNVAMEMAILDLADFESIRPGHRSRQEVHEAEAVSGSNHGDQGGRMVGNNAKGRFEATRKHRGRRLVANGLIGERIPDGDHRIRRDLLERDGLRIQNGMPVGRQKHERLTPERAHHERSAGSGRRGRMAIAARRSDNAASMACTSPSSTATSTSGFAALSCAMRPGRNSELALTKLAIVTLPATELCVERRSEIVSSIEATMERARGSKRLPASVSVRGRSRRSMREHPRACSRLAT